MLHTAVAVFFAVVVLVFGMVLYTNSRAELVVAQARADAIVIDARSAAFAEKAWALLPWGVVAGIAAPLTIMAFKYQPTKRVQNNVVIQIEQPRREVWKQLEQELKRHP